MRKALLALAIGAGVSMLSGMTADHRTPPAASHQTDGPQYWLDQLAAAWKKQDSKEGSRSLAQLVEHWPEELPKVDTRTIFWVYSEQARSVSGDELFASLSRLFATYGKTSASREPESLWMSLAFMAAERGEIDLARRVAAHLKNPHYLVNMLIDKSFDAVIDADPEEFDIERASVRYIDDLRRQVESQPRRLHLRLQLIDALLSANRFDEALRLSDSIASQVRGSAPGAGAFDDSEESFWLADSRARALWGLGRRDEALDELRRASRPAENGTANASLTINLASYLCASGRAQEALQVLDNPIWVSPYGLMYVYMVRHWAALQMNDAEAARKALEFMRQHQADNYRAFQAALVAAGRSNEAVRLLSLRLTNSTLRTDTLMQLQRFNGAAMPHAEQKRELDWRAFSDRTDVQAAVSAVGRIKQFAIGPTQGWD